MLKLKELNFSGVGRFVEEQTIHFEKLGNLIQVDGKNNNTGGSSGAGKSTVFHALDYLFGLPGKPTTVLKSRLTDDGISVKGIFDFDGKDLIITRGKKLILEVDKEITTGSSKLSEEKLDAILGIPRDLFRKMLHKRQKEGGFFLQMTPKETNEFLMSCLNLNHYKPKIDIADKKIVELTEKKNSLSNALESTKSALKATEDAILSLGIAPVKDIHQSVILELKEKADKSSKELLSLQASQKLEIESLELSRPKITEEIFDTSVRENYEKGLKEIRELKNYIRLEEVKRQSALGELISKRNIDVTHFSNLIKMGEAAKTEAIRIGLELKKIRESICPTCEQGWITSKARDLEIQHLEKIKILKESINAGINASEQIISALADIKQWSEEKIPQIHKDLGSLENKEKETETLISVEKNKEIEHRNSQNKSNRAILDDFAQKQRSIRETHTQILTQYRGQADVDRRAFEAALNKLKAYEEARLRYETSLASLKLQEQTYANKVSELTKSSAQIHKELAMAEELKRGLKSYLSRSFDDALETISENATKIIRHIPNMANATIQLVGTKETQEGKIKEEVNAIIHMDGDENVDIRSLCGGERTGADLAIDLSVIDLIESRANKGIDVFILDEPFEGLDTVCIEMALEVLKNSNTNKRLIIVDHNPEVKQMVESRLTVVRDGPTSRIVQL